MVMFILSSLFLIAAAFIIGAILGNVSKRFSAKSDSVSESSTRAADARLASLSLLGKPANDDVKKSAREAAAMIPPAEPVPAPDPAGASRGSGRKTAAPKKNQAKAEAKIVRSPRQDDKNRPALLKTARRGKPDKLTEIDGIGAVIESKLFAAGIFHYDQIAGWTPDEAAWVSEEIGFPGRAHREGWVKQAAGLVKPAAKAKPKAAPKKAAPKPVRGSTGSS
ncbi:putative flap endonuclease-1-like 5' DNA nuclease [Phyllobacterium sp. 1468]|uniref:hypothetical protein n=1 Tax=Phyllobacterium sp. 1468 TaxID=2817759 RepID=UPI00285A1EDD|nr:hypothetical protein [Phyllobacterium sp. 1468]MDR6633878.1 putative flap endonuclease-1-like 5' DNA nuclease [Phyllobacterium sp. 1468]